MEAHCTTGQVKRREWFTPMNARVALIIRGAVLASRKSRPALRAPTRRAVTEGGRCGSSWGALVPGKALPF